MIFMKNILNFEVNGQSTSINGGQQLVNINQKWSTMTNVSKQWVEFKDIFIFK